METPPLQQEQTQVLLCSVFGLEGHRRMVTISVLKTEVIKSCHVAVMLFGLARLGQFRTHSGLEAVLLYGR